MSTADATALIWDTTGPVLSFLGFIAVLLLSLSLIGLAGRW